MTDPRRPLTDEEVDRDLRLAAWMDRRRRRRKWVALITAVSMLLFLAARNAITAIWG